MPPASSCPSCDRCDALLRDPDFIFRSMWGAEPWRQWAKPFNLAESCFAHVRDAHSTQQDVSVYFAETGAGTHCHTNWYEGNPGPLGRQNQITEFSAPAPALLGFDERIDSYCNHDPGKSGHAQACVDINLNILSLYGSRVPYNICRNLEWQVCAAQGRIPGQGGTAIVFAKAPKTLDYSPESERLGMCTGWSARGYDSCKKDGYATDSIFFLEVCLFNQICKNGGELFQIEPGDVFTCDFDPQRFRELEGILAHRTPPPPPQYNVHAMRCYAHRYTDLFHGFCGDNIEACDIGALTEHWATTGQREGRSTDCLSPNPPPPPPSPSPPTPTLFNWELACYASRNPDVLDAFCPRRQLDLCDYGKVQQHWQDVGRVLFRPRECLPPPPPPPPPIASPPPSPRPRPPAQPRPPPPSPPPPPPPPGAFSWLIGSADGGGAGVGGGAALGGVSRALRPDALGLGILALASCLLMTGLTVLLARRPWRGAEEEPPTDVGIPQEGARRPGAAKSASSRFQRLHGGIELTMDEEDDVEACRFAAQLNGAAAVSDGDGEGPDAGAGRRTKKKKKKGSRRAAREDEARQGLAAAEDGSEQQMTI